MHTTSHIDVNSALIAVTCINEIAPRGRIDLLTSTKPCLLLACRTYLTGWLVGNGCLRTGPMKSRNWNQRDKEGVH